MKKYVCTECGLKQKIKDEQVKSDTGKLMAPCARCKTTKEVRHASNV